MCAHRFGGLLSVLRERRRRAALEMEVSGRGETLGRFRERDVGKPPRIRAVGSPETAQRERPGPDVTGHVVGCCL